MVDESCAVCELVRPRSSLEHMVLDAALLLKLQRFLRITPSMELSDVIIGQNDASSLDARLAGLLLYPPAIRHDVSTNTTILRICYDCLYHLYKHGGDVPPKMSIANGNVIGRVPDEFWG